VTQEKSPYLSEAELHDLTGRARRGAQTAWLRRNRWRFVLDADDKPKVARAYHDRRMADEATPPPRVEPDLSAV
jgi:hypothetical protein